MNNTHIFVVGNSRSGTTMMGRILGKNYLVFTLSEIHFFENLVSIKNLSKILDIQEAEELLAMLFSRHRNGFLNKQTPAEFRVEARGKILEWHEEKKLTPIFIYDKFLKYESEKYGGKITCIQTPRNIFFQQEILGHFPEGKVINMIRDPRDILFSQKKKWKRKFLGAKNISTMEALRSWANYHPFIISKLWNASVNKIEDFDNHQRVITIYFEELLSDPETAVKRVCSFLNIDFKTEMLEIPQIGSSAHEDDLETRGIRKDRASSWKKGGLTDTELYFCQHICDKQMEKHGYSQKTVHHRRSKVLLSYLSLPFKLGISFLLNIGRYRNLFDSLRRRFS